MTSQAATPPPAGFTEEAQPFSPGAPYLPPLALGHRIGYAITGALIVLLGNLGTNIYSADGSSIAGGYGVTSAEEGWLPVAATAAAASAYLYLIKGRQQFGIDRVIIWQLALEAAVAALLVIHPSFGMALVVRIVSGTVAATTTALAVYHLLEVFPKPKRPLALVIVIGFSQVSSSLARLLPIDMLTHDGNRGLHLICLAVPLTLLALLLGHPLPPTLKVKAFEPRDLLSVLLLVPAIVLLVAVFGFGTTYWWTETSWLGWAIAGSVLLFAVGFLFEAGREHPLLSLPWLGQGDVLRFIGIVVIERITLAEQSSGAMGLLGSAGLNSDQFHGLFGVVIAAELAGILIVVLAFSPRNIPRFVTVAFLLIAGAAWLDSLSNAETRPQQMLLSQGMIGLGTTLFIGPALVWIVGRVAKSGVQYLVTMILMFSFCQYVGAIGSGSLMGSYQYVRRAAHDAVIAEGVRGGEAVVQERIRSAAAAAASLTPDAGLRDEIGVAALDRSAETQANALGYIDVFRVIGALALVGIACMTGWHLLVAYRGRAGRS